MEVRGNMETKRLFIAINLPMELKKQLAVLEQELKYKYCNVKWVTEENFHLTIKFLGEVPVDTFDEVIEGIKAGIEAIESFNISFKKLGVFPKKDKAKVIWLGVDKGKEDVVNLFNKIESALAKVGFKKETKAYKPHLTMGRSREPQFIDIDKFPNNFEGICRVKSVDLMMSNLTHKGAVYTLIESVDLIE